MNDRRKIFHTTQVTPKRLPATTYTPTTSNQTIASDTILLGTQTISGDANLAVGNIKSGVNIFGVAGTFMSTGGPGLCRWRALNSYGTFYNNANITGPGIALLYSGGNLKVYLFKSTCTSDGSGVCTLDGVNTSWNLQGYGYTTGIIGYQFKAGGNNLNITGPGIAYVEVVSNQNQMIFFLSTLTTDASGKPTVDGVTFYNNNSLKGYAI